MKKTLLSNLLLSCVLSLVSFVSKAQWVIIPDTAFVNYLHTQFPGCMNGNQMDTTCAAILSTTTVFCNQKHISDLTGIQYFDSLTHLECFINDLTFLPDLPKRLVELTCSMNQLNSLPTLPDSLKILDCGHNPITALPTLPPGLKEIYCENNLLTSLPVLPTGFTVLYCSYNQLGVLPSLPASLVSLTCEVDSLFSLPSLPDSLTSLVANNNYIAQLNAFPSKMNYVEFRFNPISTVPEFPDSLDWLDVIGDSNLHCLPLLKNVTHLMVGSTSITCLPEYGHVTVFNPPFGLPLCDSTNTNGCPFCHAHFSIYPDTLNAGVYYGFNDSYGSSLTSYLWDFGDSSSSTMQYPSHTYAQPGHYEVCLTTIGPDCSSTYCDSSFYVFKTEGGLMNQLNILNPNTTGISETNSAPSFAISPNPASNTVTVSIDETLLGSILAINDITGRELMHSAVQIRNPKSAIQNFSSGVYFVTIENEKGRSTKKLIIQK